MRRCLSGIRGVLISFPNGSSTQAPVFALRFFLSFPFNILRRTGEEIRMKYIAPPTNLNTLASKTRCSTNRPHISDCKTGHQLISRVFRLALCLPLEDSLKEIHRQSVVHARETVSENGQGLAGVPGFVSPRERTMIVPPSSFLGSGRIQANERRVAFCLCCC